PPDLPNGGLDRAPLLGYLLVGESPVRGPEGKSQSKALPSLADLLTAVEVEHLGRAEKLATAIEHGSPNLRGRKGLIDDDGHVLMDRGVGDHVLVGLLAHRGSGDEGREIDLEPGSGLEVPLPAHQRMDLPDPARVGTLDEHAAAPAGVQERLLTRHHLDAG